MWVVTMFDLPTETKEARRAYSLFRKMLLEDGFTQTQYSIYSRHCASEENAAVHIQRVERNVRCCRLHGQFELLQVKI